MVFVTLTVKPKFDVESLGSRNHSSFHPTCQRKEDCSLVNDDGRVSLCGL